jgi:hypothetical protein
MKVCVDAGAIDAGSVACCVDTVAPDAGTVACGDNFTCAAGCNVEMQDGGCSCTPITPNISFLDDVYCTTQADCCTGTCVDNACTSV